MLTSREKISQLEEVSKVLAQAQLAFKEAVESAVQLTGKSLVKSMGDKDIAIKGYRQIEKTLVQPYRGGSSDTAAVRSAIANGECFPAWPYISLPDESWWSTLNKTVQPWDELSDYEQDRWHWVARHTLSAAGWELDIDTGIWYTPPTRINSEDVFESAALRKLRETCFDEA